MSCQVLAIVVTYNPDESVLKDLLLTISKQAEAVMLVDNNSSNIQNIRRCVADLSASNVVLSEQAENVGLGAAHNIGITYAREYGFSHVLILDQDSLPAENMLLTLLNAWQTLASEHKVSAVGASYENLNGGQSFFVRMGKWRFQRTYCDQANQHEQIVPCDFLISSGSLISLACLSEVGDMDESLFIDHVDTEWFLRANHRGYRCFGVCKAVMTHSLGESVHRVKIGRRVRNVPQHKPFRYYYIFRNSVLLYRRNYCHFYWKWNDVQRLVSILIMYGMVVGPRLKHLHMMLLGVYHGVLNRTGKLEL